MESSSQVEPFLALLLALLWYIDFGVLFVKGIISISCNETCIFVNISLQRPIRLYPWIN